MTVNTRYGENRKSETNEMVDDENFIVCWGFMRREMKLEKTELMVYAVIYGMYRTGEMYDGTVGYLSQWTGSGITAVRTALASLLKKEYITKKVTKFHNRDCVEYGINISKLPKIKMHERVHELNEEYKAECMIQGAR